MATCTYDGVEPVFVVAVGTTSILVRIPMPITTTSTINVLTISKTNLFNECVWVEGIGWNKRHIPMTLGLHICGDAMGWTTRRLCVFSVHTKRRHTCVTYGRTCRVGKVALLMMQSLLILHQKNVASGWYIWYRASR